ncbi:MAG: aldo/keto reductase, partial [Clostridiales bacterium]|nr:aldo/keto reductase [Clostridiales bacterium]
DEERAVQIKQLYNLAKERGQTLSQLAVEWLLQEGEVTSVLVGVHSKTQLLENLGAINCEPLSEYELSLIDKIIKR